MKTKRVVKLNPSQLLMLVFLISVGMGTILLKLPISTHTSITYLDALFTATSSMTVTGLATVDIGSTFTLTGQFIIAILIQLGGLGIMSFGIFIFMMLGKRIGMKERIVLQHAFNQTSIGGMLKLVKYVFVFSITIELVAMFILAFRWIPQYGVYRGLFYSFFHAISAFNNAGMALMPNNLMAYVGDPLVNIVVTTLIIIGGIGFTVLIDLYQKRTYKKLTLHTKMMLVGTIVINLFAMFMIFLLEYDNAKTLGELSLSEKLWASYFQAVSPRTAGFNTIDIGSLHESTLFLTVILMFIGAGSSSTGGGIKVTTAFIIFLATFAFLQGKAEITIWRRKISQDVLLKGLAITMISSIIIIVAVMILMVTEHTSFIVVLFEVVSAFSTVGLSTGITDNLSPLGKQILIILLFLGKLGPLTLIYSLTKQSHCKISYPKEDILIG
ncbi:TrkH family potassium uptake protein [Metabacillus malikii]|uniref:Trk system potassium uptake protein TrkH n=1 Tax=Metabacillus malikii TaxID=1504265 RepID=A0ABT9ZBN4_9BACI|nr:TrkH family potassium uptake protein [Metabacillus malikii]MDQ0229666.1 trk system potassium uptake protein TrkH [Metabacillus malikii]